MNILLCLISDQHIPNLLSVHHFKPDRLVLIETGAMRKKKAVDYFLGALKVEGLDYSARCDRQSLDEEDTLDAIKTALKAVYERYPSEKWTVNLTGGTKLMSIAAYEYFKEKGARLIYISNAKPNTFLTLGPEKEEVSHHRISIQAFLAGYGFEFGKKADQIAKSEERALSWWNCARMIAAEASSEDLLSFQDSERNKARQKGYRLEAEHFSNISDELKETIDTTFNLKGLQGDADKYIVQFLTGGWLDVFLWGLLDKHKDDLGIWDIRLGIEVTKGESNNEIDIAFMFNHALHIVECKSGNQEQDPNTDILYKLEAVTRQFRALRVRSYLATMSGKVFDGTGELKKSIGNRAAIYDCTIFTKNNILLMAQSWQDSARIKEWMRLK